MKLCGVTTRWRQRWFVALVLCVSWGARADELPPNACLGMLGAGDACSMDDGTPGKCIEERHEYVDADGSKHTWSELICQPVVSSAQRSVLPWVGVGLAFLAVCAALATRPPRPPRGVQSRS